MQEWTLKEWNEGAKEGVTVLDFWAPWCGPCRMMAPNFAAAAEKFEGKATFAKINVDENEELARQFAISAIPTVVIVKDGAVKDKNVGMMDEAALSAFVSRNL